MTEIGSTALDRAGLNERWQERFRFFDEFGVPSMWKASPEYAKGLRTLPFRARNRVTFSFLGFFFTYFYLLALGLWRKAVVWFLVNMAFVALSFVLWPDSGLWTGLFVGLGCGPATRVGAYYYELKVKGEQTWAL